MVFKGFARRRMVPPWQRRRRGRLNRWDEGDQRERSAGALRHSDRRGGAGATWSDVHTQLLSGEESNHGGDGCKGRIQKLWVIRLWSTKNIDRMLPPLLKHIYLLQPTIDRGARS